MNNYSPARGRAVRSAKWDNVKLFLIFCVVLGHFGNEFAKDSYLLARLQFWIYIFHMPAFVFVSGMFSRHTVKERRFDRIVPYILLFCFMKGLRFAVDAWLEGINEAELDFFKEAGMPWFLLALFFWYLVAILVQQVHPVYVMAAALLLSLICGYSESLGSWFALRRSVVFFPFFWLGFNIDHNALLNKMSDIRIRAAGLITAALSMLAVFMAFPALKPWRDLFRGNSSYARIAESFSAPPDHAYGWLWRLAAYMISFVVMMAVLAGVSSARTFVTGLGAKTLPIYVFHGSVIKIIAENERIAGWISAHHTGAVCIILAFVTVVLTALPVFDIPLKMLMRVPKTGKRIEDRSGSRYDK